MFNILALVGWQRKILEHGPTWCVTIGSAFLLFGLLPYLVEACRHKKTFGTSKAFFILWGLGCLCMAGNSVMYLIRDGMLKLAPTSTGAGTGTQPPQQWMIWLKHCSFAGANILVSLANFYAFIIKRKNVIESRKLGISEEKYWETMVNYHYDEIILENTNIEDGGG